MSNVVAIAAVECGHAIESLTDAPIEDRLRAAMRVAKTHWLAPSEDQKILAACEAVYAQATGDEQARLKAELESMNRVGHMLNALQAGVAVDFEQMVADKEAREAEGLPEPIGIAQLWREVVEA